MSIDNSRVVFFPPPDHADFVLHYANTSFHVNKLVLYHHSAYFRTYFQTLPTAPSPSTSSKSTKKRKRAQRRSSSSAEESHQCDHPAIAHCIHLPQLTMLVGKDEVHANDFRVFLCHLYFSHHYCYPPCLPKTDIELDAPVSPPMSFVFPRLPSLDWSNDSPQLRFRDEWYVFNESLLTLAHYFDCAAMMAQCEAVMLSLVKDGKKAKKHEWLSDECLMCLPHILRYHLDKCKTPCVEIIAADEGVLERQAYQAAKQVWDKALLAEIMEALHKANRCVIC